MIRPIMGTVGRISVLSLVIPFGLGLACGFLTPAALLPYHIDRQIFALLLAVALSVSAIPVIAKTLHDMRLMHRDLGQLILATATVDDAVAWLGLSVISAMVITGATGAKFALSALYLGGFLVAAFVIGRPLVRMAAARAARFSEPAAVLTAVAFLVIFLGAAVSDALGFEAVFGAFVAGTLLTAADVSRIVLARIKTVVMAVLAPIFLASAGLRMDVTALRHPAAMVTALALLVTAVIGKFAGAYAGGRLSRLGAYESMAVGAGLNSRGVVQIVIAMVGLRLGLFSITVYTILLVVAVGTSIMTAPMLRFSMRHIAEQDHEQRRRVEFLPEDRLETTTVA
jgi:Kef-type K+ transport system membrane component KefB